MNILLMLLAVVILVCLVLVTAMSPEKPRYSRAELKRRAKKSTDSALEAQRSELYPVFISLLRATRAMLLVLLVCALIGALGWGWGLVFALLLAVFYPSIARLAVVRRNAQKLYIKGEPTILRYMVRFERALRALRDPATSLHEAPRRLYSREDLIDILNQSQEVLSPNEQKLVTSTLEFFDKNVAEVMTPRTVINFINKTEFLGPLVLDELHELGHSRLPVIDKDLDHIVGILHLRDLLSLDVRRSATAEKVMEKKVYYIHQDDTLEHALAAFLKTRHHLFIVINDTRETVGLLTLEDTVEAMIGRQIIDEDDIHADMRAVALREGKTNNASEGRVDV